MTTIRFQFNAETVAGAPVRKGYAERKGMIFAVGHYADKNFTATPEDLRLYAEQFRPVDLNLDHLRVPKLQNADLGRLEHVWLSADGQELHGRLSVRTALEELVGKGGGVSVEIDPSTKRIVGIALTDNPRVGGAAVFSKENSMPDNEEKGLLDWLKEKFRSEKAPAPEQKVEMSQPAEDPRIAQMAAELDKVRDEQITTKAEAEVNGLLHAKKILPAQVPGLTAAFAQAMRDDQKNPTTINFATDKDGKALTGSRVDGLRHSFASLPALDLYGERMEGDRNGLNVVEFAKSGQPDPKAMADRKSKLKKMAGMTPKKEAC